MRRLLLPRLLSPGNVLVGSDLMRRLGDIKFNFKQNRMMIQNHNYDFCIPSEVQENKFQTKPLCYCKKDKIEIELDQPIYLEANKVTIHPVEVPFEPDTYVWVEGQTNGAVVANTHMQVKDRKVLIAFINNSDTSTISADTKISIRQLKEADTDWHNFEEDPIVCDPDLSHLDSDQQNKIKAIIADNHKAFSLNETDIGYCDLIEH